MSRSGDPRGEGVEPPAWWLKRFHDERERRKREDDKAAANGNPKPYAEGVVDLGIDLAEKIGRPRPWNHSVVSNFINGERYTREMAEAFSLLYDIPRFEAVVRAETEAQAIELEMFLRRFARSSQSGNVSRVESVDQRAAELTELAEDQIDGVKSIDETVTRDRRTRRAARRS